MNRAHWFFAGIMICVLAAFPPGVRADDQPPAPVQVQDKIPVYSSSYFGSEISPADRFVIVQSPLAEKNVFRFDRICGAIELLVWNDDRKIWFWQAMRIPDLFPCTNDGRNHYQFFSTVQDEHVFLIHTDTKVTWRLDRTRMAWVHMY